MCAGLELLKRGGVLRYEAQACVIHSHNHSLTQEFSRYFDIGVMHSREKALLAELGRGRAQDQVDAQNDLTAAKNQRTQTLVDHTVARLRFWEHMGILFIKERGQWQDVSHVNKLKTP
jgi:hypothetical protein